MLLSSASNVRNTVSSLLFLCTWELLVNFAIGIKVSHFRTTMSLRKEVKPNQVFGTGIISLMWYIARNCDECRELKINTTNKRSTKYLVSLYIFFFRSDCDSAMTGNYQIMFGFYEMNFKSLFIMNSLPLCQ